MTRTEEIQQSLSLVRGEVERMENLGLKFAASLLRIAVLELQVCLHQVSEEEIDALNFVATAVPQERDAIN